MRRPFQPQVTHVWRASGRCVCARLLSEVMARWTLQPCYAACTQNNTMSHVTVCHPLQWRVNTTKVMLNSCPEYGMALFHERRMYNKTLQASTS
jgi:hypothetical protein